ncbi:hypothetical protein AGMMS50212_02140 [Spirochaetia bacterium]|nr:hypothetical protein AGMMS50212_02140 [Spirochaetia bacterium]
MADGDFLAKLKEALDARRNWFEVSEFPKMKEECRNFHTAISAIYGNLTKKGFIAEDPYKNDNKISDIDVPDSSPMSESNRRDQIGLRLAALDNQFDFFVNFYPFAVENFTQPKIKIILGLIKYIDWVHLSPDGGNANTQAISTIITDVRRQGAGDPLSAKVLSDALFTLSKTTASISNYLKQLSDFNRELYKFDLRMNVTSSMSVQEANAANIKKKMSQTMPGESFYPELAEEVIKEDFSGDSKNLQEKLLKKLAVEGAKPKTATQKVSLKPILIEGLNAIGSSGTNISEIMEKVKENHELMQNQRNSFWAKLKRAFAQITNAEPEPVIYELEYTDPNKNTPVKDKVNFNTFSSEVDKKTAILAAMAPKGGAAKKLESMEEKQLVELLQRNIKDVQSFHKTLNNLDEYFKNEIKKEDRVKVRGIKPELSALKNAITKANQKLYDYHAIKEEEEQFKRLGIDTAG